MKPCPAFLSSLLLAGFAMAAEPNSPTDAGAAYTRAITQRADKIAGSLSLGDSGKTLRVREILIRQYRDLNRIHEGRDAEIKAAQEKFRADRAATDAGVQAVRDAAKPKLDVLHGEFLARLSAELAPEQLEKVKDGLTYGVLPHTYGVYLKMYPELTVEQKNQIMTWLVEAREIAMDGSTSAEKHAVFDKYKGKITNYLSKAGYDAKKGEQNLRKANPPAENKPK